MIVAKILLGTACKCGFFYRNKKNHTIAFPNNIVLKVEPEGMHICTSDSPHTSEFDFFIPKEYLGKIVKAMLFLAKTWE